MSKRPKKGVPRRPKRPPDAFRETDAPLRVRIGRPRPVHPVNVPLHLPHPHAPGPHPVDGIPHRPPHKLPAPRPRPRPRPLIPHAIRLQFIATTNTITFDPSLLIPVVAGMNDFFASGALAFTYDPARDFVVLDNALLDQDWELLDAGSLANPESMPPAVDSRRFHDERQRVARQYLGKLVVYVSRGSFLSYQATTGWTVGERPFHYSSIRAEYVATAATYWRAPGGSIDPNTLAHEIGHYLHEFHTMNPMPATLAEAADWLRTAVDSWGWTPDGAPRVFDADFPFVTDTPPDPGPPLFETVNGSPCGGANFIDVPVTFAAGTTRTYRIAPDRTNLMSYFKGCPGPHGFSQEQFVRMRTALEHGNRNHLITGFGSWIPAAPAVVGPDSGTVAVTILDATSSPWYQVWTSEDIAMRPAWRWLGGSLRSVSAVSDAPGNVDIIATDYSGYVLHHALRPAVWPPDLAWNVVGNKRFGGDATAVSWGPGRLDVIVRDGDGSLSWISRTGGTWRTAWQSLGGSCVGIPAVACWGPGRIDVVAWRADRGVSHIAYDGTSWSSWQSLNGEISGPPSLASWGAGRLDLVVRGMDNAIYHKWFAAGVWSPSWEYLGGNFTGRPSIVASAGNRLDLVARSADGALWHKAWDGAVWVPGTTNWRPLGGDTVDSPSVRATQIGAGRRLDIFARARDGSLVHAALDPASNQIPGSMSFTQDLSPIDW